MDTQLHQHITTISNGGGSGGSGGGGIGIGGNGAVSVQRDDEYRERMLRSKLIGWKI